MTPSNTGHGLDLARSQFQALFTTTTKELEVG